MSERSEQHERPSTAADDSLGGGLTGDDSSTESPADDSRFSRGGLLKTGAITVAGLAVPAAIASAVVPFVGGPLGLFAGAFLLGLVSGVGYLPAGVVGAGLGVAGVLGGNMLEAMAFGAGPQLALVGAVAGLALSALGLYFGRDLKTGLTQEL